MVRYQLIIYWSDQDHTFIVEVPELPGCMADGATYQEALANAEVVMQEWIETTRELGRPIPEPKGRLMFHRDVANDRQIAHANPRNHPLLRRAVE